jgi:selenide,water dikinase
VDIEWDNLPIFPLAASLAQTGIGTGAADRNWASYGNDVTLPPGMPDWQRKLLCDPQTSGGLLIACADNEAPEVLDFLKARDFAHAALIGTFRPGPPLVRVSAPTIDR